MVTLVATVGNRSLDLYAQKLAQNLHVAKIYSDIYQRNARLFNVPIFCRQAVKAAWGDWRFIRMLNRRGGVVHLPNHHLGRYGLFLKIPYIVTVHDLIRYFDLKGYGTYIHRPNLRDRFYLSMDYRGIKKAARVIAISETTKRDLIQHLGIPEEDISVVYLGIDHKVFSPVERRHVDYPYILFVGSEQPRKNFIGLLKAFKMLKSRHGFKDLKVVKVGMAGGREADFRKTTLQAIQELELSRDVILTDFVPLEDLPAYYSGAECFILPSLYEGFGLPPLEAMACGCPVIVSDIAALPEVTGDAAILVDPHDTKAMADALYLVLKDERLRKDLAAKGVHWARQFTWERTARETLQVYESVEGSLGTGRGPVRLRQDVGPGQHLGAGQGKIAT